MRKHDASVDDDAVVAHRPRKSLVAVNSAVVSGHLPEQVHGGFVYYERVSRHMSYASRHYFAARLVFTISRSSPRFLNCPTSLVWKRIPNSCSIRTTN